MDPLQKYNVFCDLSVRKKAWRAASQAFERMHNTLSHRVKTCTPRYVVYICFRDVARIIAHSRASVKYLVAAFTAKVSCVCVCVCVCVY